MAFSGNPITHNFGVTAFGRSKRPASPVDNDKGDSIPVKRFRRATYVPQPGDPQRIWDIYSQPATSTDAPTNDLVAATAAGPSTSGESSKPGVDLGVRQDENVKVKAEVGDHGMKIAGQDEIIEISSDEYEEDEEDSDLDPDEHIDVDSSPENPHTGSGTKMQLTPNEPSQAEASVSNTTAQAGQSLKTLIPQGPIARSFKKSGLLKLSTRVPLLFAANHRNKAVETMVWSAIVAYFDHLRGTELAKKKNNKHKDRIHVIRWALMNHFRVNFGRKFTKLRNGALDQRKDNIHKLIASLHWYFDRYGKPVKGRTPAENATSIQLFSSGANQQLPASLVENSAELEARDDDSSHQRGSDYVRELSAAAPYKRAWRNATQYEAAGYYIKSQPDNEAPQVQVKSTKPAASDLNHRSYDGQISVPPATQDQATIPSSASRPSPEELTADSATSTAAVSAPDVSRNPASSSTVYDSVSTLKLAIKKAIEQKLDWKNVPVAIFEAEIALKRIQTALEKAKEAIAQHGHGMDRD